MDKFEAGRLDIETIKAEILGFHELSKGKKDIFNMLRKIDIKTIKTVEEYDNSISEENVLCLFFCQEFVKNNPNRLHDHIKFLEKLTEENGDSNEKPKLIAVDLDFLPNSELSVEEEPKKILIYHFSEHNIKSFDFKKDIEKTRQLCMATCKQRGDEAAPKEKGKFIMPCPNFYKGICPAKSHDWLCTDCQTYLDYGFNDSLYCNCANGKGTFVDFFEFRCNDVKHGFDYVKFDERCKTYFDQMVPRENISIIILGQSGVGKSTWINSIANYMLYEDIITPKQGKGKVITAIPTKFTIIDESYESKIIQIGEDENEETNIIGASGTQDCRTYSFPYEEYNLELIDTPGLGDSRGIEQDQENLKKILDYIRHQKKLHGICILLKPNETRIGVLMRFCFKEILTRLHKNCINNIVFCFTNARATLYTPGGTLPVVEKYLREIQVSMPINKNTIYCFDNEAYRYLCTHNYEGIEYTSEEEESFVESWNKSVEETKRLLEYVSKLPPHYTQETMTLNQARRIILSLIKPIADISHNIEVNIDYVNNHKHLIESMDEKDKQLSEQLYVPQITLECVPLQYPRTVCTADCCVKYHVLSKSGIQLREYVQHCHPHCFLKGVTPEKYPNPDLKNCAAMKDSPGGELCLACGCAWNDHMHILYDQIRTEIRVKNESVKHNIESQSDLRKEKETAIKDLESRVAKLEEEKKKIIEIAGKFACFLKKHAITPYNDCFGDYLDYLIDKEEKKKMKTDREIAILKNLTEIKAKYEEEIKFLEKVMTDTFDTENYGPDDVKKWEEELYQLPIHGKQLEGNMKSVMEVEDAAARHNVKHLAAPKNVSPKKGSIRKSIMKTVKNLNPFKSKGKKT